MAESASKITITTESLDDNQDTAALDHDTQVEVEEIKAVVEEIAETSQVTANEGDDGGDDSNDDPTDDDTETAVTVDEGAIENSPYGKLRTRNIVNEMETSYLNYAMSVIVSRALPDVRDGMKPVHRRILFSMHKSGINHSGPHRKCARIVGDVLGRYHPHGDSSVYMALVRLAQDFSMRYPLVDGQGNFGSIDGDSPAAMRYTEAKMAKIASELMADIDKDTVDMTDNFDQSIKEPAVLPGKLPNLLLMGSEGIAVGMATKIPPHNLTEVCNAIIATVKAGQVTPLEGDNHYSFELPDDPSQINTASDLIDQVAAAKPTAIAGHFDSDISFEEIMTHIQGPDFPTAGIIYDKKAIDEAYSTGRGRIVTRAKAEIVENKKGGYQIIVTEIPYQVNKSKLIMKIADLVKDKRIVGIRDLNDDSDRKGLQITIDLKKDAKPKVILNKLFKLTELQTSFPMNVVALNSEGVPQLMNIKQILREYIIHRQIVIIRRSQYELVKARNRAHILEGLIIALNNLDDVIETIRRSADTETAKNALIKKFGLTEVQALAILEMQLKRLAALERQKIEDEYKQIQQTIAELLTLLNKPTAVLDTIASEAQELIDTYGDKRRTKVVKGKVGEFSDEDLINNEPAIVTLTQSGYIKRLSPDSFRAQSRGGKGASGVKMKETDGVKSLLTVNTHDFILLFTNLGRVFKLRAFEIPEASKQAKGTAAVNLISLKQDERVENILIFDPVKDQDKFIALVTRQGLVKKTKVKLFENIRQNGIIAIDLNKEDNLVWGKITSGQDDIMLITHTGKSIRFSEKEVKASARDTKGVKGITLLKDDYVVGVESITKDEIDHDDNQHLLVVTENGLGKRTKLSEYPPQKRAGIGVKVSEVTSKTGKIAMAGKVDQDSEELIISTGDGQTIKVPVADGKAIPVLGRPTQGVILIRPADGDRVVTATITVKQELKPTPTTEAPAAS